MNAVTTFVGDVLGLAIIHNKQWENSMPLPKHFFQI